MINDSITKGIHILINDINIARDALSGISVANIDDCKRKIMINDCLVYLGEFFGDYIKERETENEQ